MNTFGIEVGSITLLIIGLGFVWVIYGERFLGYLWWPYFLLAGILMLTASLFIPSAWGSVLVGIIGGSFIWGSTEFKEQAVRAELGWFKNNKNKIRPPFERIIKKWKAPHL